MEIPYVSVIIPMYNVEKYIGELLDSLLAQTLINFEVIVVDDCSTDKSFEIVENYQPKFEGRLQLMKLPTNSGGAAIPRNHGLEMSRGKYIFFADADDVTTPTALEDMFNLAEKFGVDVVYCEKYFQSSGTGEDFQKNIKVHTDNASISQIENLISENIVDRINIWLQGKFGVMPWRCLTLRSFLIDSDIKFHNIRRDDVLWSFEVLFSAKKILRTPNPNYILRRGIDSITSNNKTLTKFFRHWLDRTVNGLKLLEDFMLKINFFKEKPDARYILMSHWVVIDLQIALHASKKLPPPAVKEIFQKTFSNDLGDKAALVSFLFANSLALMKDLAIANKKIEELKKAVEV